MTDSSFQAMFSAQMQSLDPMREPDSIQPLELLLDDGLPLRISLHPNNRHWVVEAFVYDAVAIQGPLRSILVDTLLQINGAAIEGRQIICTLNHSDLVVLMTRWPAEETEPDDFLSWLDYTVSQARRIREAVRAIAMHGDDLDWQPSNFAGDQS